MNWQELKATVHPCLLAPLEPSAGRREARREIEEKQRISPVLHLAAISGRVSLTNLYTSTTMSPGTTS